ncbi:VOC family protein [Pusillimonas sp.]|uniref:VOC family protein n=1 Tax=Pusillimonas sp. TaxID=3040095 RepID=UPI0037C62FBB
MQAVKPALFQPDRFAHANLFVADVDESVDFYRDFCGINVVFREPGVKAGFLSNGATHHDVGLMQVSDKPLIGKDGKVQNSMERGRTPGLNHIAFHVGSEQSLVDAYRDAAEYGIRIEKALDHGLSRSLYLFDPDGNAVEFYIDIVNDWRQFYRDHQNELISINWDPAGEPLAPRIEPELNMDEPVADAPVHALEICGATLVTRGLTKAVQFYTEVGGLQLLALNESDGVALLALPGNDYPSLALCQAGADVSEAGLHSVWFLARGDSPVFNQKLDRPSYTYLLEPDRRCSVVDPNGFHLVFYPGTDKLPRTPTRHEVVSGITT